MRTVLRILAINPKKTSTEFALFENESCLLFHEIEHGLLDEKNLEAQVELRRVEILENLFARGINIGRCAAIVARGGLLRPLQGGTYEVNKAMKNDLQVGFASGHASSMGGWIASAIAENIGIPAFIVDPVTVDEFEDVARITGIPEIQRKSIFHALSQKAAARKAAKALRIEYETSNFIVLHLGGGITVGAHRHGRVIDTNNGLHGEGPIAPERAGTVPAGDLVAMCYSGKYSEEEMLSKIFGNAGLSAYLGTNRMEEASCRAQAGDALAAEILEAIIYQSAKEIGAMSTVLQGNIQAIVLTGNLNSEGIFVKKLTERVEWIADVLVFSGENILESLASGALRVLQGNEAVKVYTTGND